MTIVSNAFYATKVNFSVVYNNDLIEYIDLDIFYKLIMIQKLISHNNFVNLILIINYI